VVIYDTSVTHNIFPATDNNVFLPVLNINKTVFVLVSEVARFEPAVFR
jgi:hypothetical protein